MPYITHARFLQSGDVLIAAAKVNGGQAAVVDDLRLQLEKNMAAAREAQARRNVHKAAAQQASRDFDSAMESSKKIYSRLRHSLIGLFGLDAEKLAEFGLQPFRPPQVTLRQRVKRFLAREEREQPPPSQTGSTN
ncbi:MAG: hypothetical protein QOH06_4755 [Acidobacteriota bacterium]|jgi:hypothetical protein|nr:hypothetical protein [Acidobacteriota bacterium]